MLSILKSLPVLLPALATQSAPPFSSPIATPTGVPSGLVWADFNSDGLDDVFAVSPGEYRLLQNLGNGLFENVTELLAIPATQDVRAAAWADWNGDGTLDLFLASGAGESRLLSFGSSGLFEDTTANAGLRAMTAIDATWLDFDADGRADLRLTTPSGERLYRNLGSGFAPVDLGLAPIETRPGAFADVVEGGESDAPGDTSDDSRRARERTSNGDSRRTVLPDGELLDPANPGNAFSNPNTNPAFSPVCTPAVEDQAAGACIEASRTPTVGMLYPLGSDFFIQGGTGRVGIGTMAPLGLLDVAGSIRTSGSTGGRFVAYNPNNQGSTVQLGWLNDVARFRVGGNGPGANGGFDFQRVGDQSMMRILDNGRIGMGTTAPVERLDVRGDLHLRSDSDVNTSITSGTVQIRNTSGSQALLIDSNEIASFGGALNLNTTDIGLPVRVNGDTLYVDPNGWVGIGTDTPTWPLDVNGNIRSSNRIEAKNMALSNSGTVLSIDQTSSLNGATGLDIDQSSNGSDGLSVQMLGTNTSASAAGVSSVISNGAARAIEATSQTGITADFQSSNNLVLDLNRTTNTGDIMQARNSTDIEFRIESSGDVYCDGTFTGGGADYAEWLQRADYEEAMGPADVIGVRGGLISKNLEDAEQLLVVSTNPALIGNSANAEDDSRDGYEVVAFIGQAPVKVRGKVRSGDFIVPSGENDGTAIAVSPRKLAAADLSNIVGRAWEDSDAEGLRLVNIAIGVDQAAAAAIVISDLHAELERLGALSDRVGSLEATVADLRALLVE